MRNCIKNKAFSLFEMAIVLLIIAFVAIAIITGGGLLENAKVKAQIGFMNKIKTAHNNFYLKYGSYAGDYNNAASHESSTMPNFSMHIAENGNGNGWVEMGASNRYLLENVPFYGETAYYFLQLKYFGFYDDISPRRYHAEKGVDYPANPYDTFFASIILPARLFDIYDDVATTYTPSFDKLGGKHYLFMNVEAPFIYDRMIEEGNIDEFGYAFDVRDALKMDKKIDDGTPMEGALVAPEYFSKFAFIRPDYPADFQKNAQCANYNTNEYLEVYSGDRYDCGLIYQLDLK